MMRARRPSRATVIELSIPLQYAAAAGSEADTEDVATDCHICAEPFCKQDECCRALTHLSCCTQPICCGCLVRTAKRCTCRDDCDQVIAFCPFCRMIGPCDALDLFRGACVKPCRACAAKDDAPAAPPPPPEQ